MSAYAAREVPALNDEHYEDDAPLVLEGDIHEEDVIAYEDEAWEARRDDERCLPGCPHHGRCDSYPF